MSNYANFINLITNLTNRLNSIESNSKKTEELPVQTVLDPASKLRVSRGGTSEQISVGNIIDAIENQNFNQLLSVGEITANPSSILIEASTTAVINRGNYGVYTDTTIPVELCDPGLRRKDILIITTSNVIVSISGEQTNGPIVLAPPTPINSVFITDFDVTDSAIGIPTDPITGTQFIKKSYGQPFLFSGSGSDAIIPLDPLGKSEIRLQNPALVSIAGFDLSLITGVTGAEVPYYGKPYIIRNLTGSAITIKNESAADYPFYLSGGGDLVFPNGQAIYALYDVAGFSEIFKSWSDSSSDVLEFANLAAFPVTGETSKIYLALDTNKTYRWAGSAYVQIGGTAKKTENLFFQDAMGSTVRTITADQKNMHQSRILANASPYGVLGLTLGTGITEVGGVVNLSYFSDVTVSQVTGNYTGKVKKIVFSYARNVNESSANTNVMIRVMADTKYLTDMQLICEHNLISSSLIAFSENKVELPILSHLPLSAFSNIRWCVRTNNATAQQFGIIRLNVIVEEI